MHADGLESGDSRASNFWYQAVSSVLYDPQPRWYFQDPSGARRGPFPTLFLVAWWRYGFLDERLPISQQPESTSPQPMNRVLWSLVQRTAADLQCRTASALSTDATIRSAAEAPPLGSEATPGQPPDLSVEALSVRDQSIPAPGPASGSVSSTKPKPGIATPSAGSSRPWPAVRSSPEVDAMPRALQSAAVRPGHDSESISSTLKRTRDTGFAGVSTDPGTSEARSVSDRGSVVSSAMVTEAASSSNQSVASKDALAAVAADAAGSTSANEPQEQAAGSRRRRRRKKNSTDATLRTGEQGDHSLGDASLAPSEAAASTTSKLEGWQQVKARNRAAATGADRENPNPTLLLWPSAASKEIEPPEHAYLERQLRTRLAPQDSHVRLTSVDALDQLNKLVTNPGAHSDTGSRSSSAEQQAGSHRPGYRSGSVARPAPWASNAASTLATGAGNAHLSLAGAAARAAESQVQHAQQQQQQQRPSRRSFLEIQREEEEQERQRLLDMLQNRPRLGETETTSASGTARYRTMADVLASGLARDRAYRGTVWMAPSTRSTGGDGTAPTTDAAALQVSDNRERAAPSRAPDAPAQVTDAAGSAVPAAAASFWNRIVQDSGRSKEL